MPNELITDLADLRIYPKLIIAPKDNERPVFGDMHGNALKLIYLLIKFNLVRSPQEDYEQFRDIYLKSTSQKTHYPGIEDQTNFAPLSAEDLALCKEIISRLVINKSSSLCLVGDLLADRGKCDLLTLWIIEKLSLAELDLEIIFSNHDAIFIAGMENTGSLCDPSLPRVLREDQRNSLNSLIELIRTGLVSEKEVRNLYNTYKKHLCLFSLHSNKTEACTLITHAPVAFNQVAEAASLLGVDYQEGSAKELVETVRRINREFQSHVKTNTVTTVLTPAELFTSKETKNPTNPFMKLIWYRNNPSDELRPLVVCGIGLEYAHGHMSVEKKEQRSHVHTLDNSHLGSRYNLTRLLEAADILIKQSDGSYGIDYSALDATENPTLRHFTETGAYPHCHALMGPCMVLLQERETPAPCLAEAISSEAAAEKLTYGYTTTPTLFLPLLKTARSEKTTRAEADIGALAHLPLAGLVLPPILTSGAGAGAGAGAGIHSNKTAGRPTRGSKELKPWRSPGGR